MCQCLQDGGPVHQLIKSYLFVQLNSGEAVDLDELDDPFRDDDDIPEQPAESKPVPRGLSMAEQVDEIIDHSIEIESNKRMRNANLNAWTLRFNDVATENKVSPTHVKKLMLQKNRNTDENLAFRITIW